MPMTITTMTSLMTTITALKVALSLMPLTRTIVRIQVMSTAGRSKYDPVGTKPAAGQPDPGPRQ